MHATSPTYPYAGDVSALEAWDRLAADANAALVDVRTPEEWKDIGVPDLSELHKDIIYDTLTYLPFKEINPQFGEAITKKITDKDTPLIFMCKVGGRSLTAATMMAQQGYRQCYNLTDGFEEATGWKACNLPWRAA